jgi:hypothetical protein
MGKAMTLTISEDETRNISLSGVQGFATDESSGWPDNWILEARQVFRKLFRLPSNWDGQGTPSPDGEIVNAAHRLVEALAKEDCPRPTAISPTPSSGVQIEWERGARYLEVELLSNPLRALYFFSEEESGVETEGEIRVDSSLSHVLEMARRTCNC